MTAIEIIGYTGYVVGAVIILTSKTKTDNLNDLKERVAILEREREVSREQHIENQKSIANLQGQLATYKEIPLKSIASSLEKLTESNTVILDTLTHSAVIAQQASNDGGLLVKTKKTNPLDVKVKKES